MAREHVIGIITGLVLLASVLGMIGSMGAVARVLRAPPAMAEMMAIAHLNLPPAKRR